MTKFNIGDRIELNPDSPFNRNTKDVSTQTLLKYLESHSNVFTVTKTHDSPSGVSQIVYLAGINERVNGFFSTRFKLIPESAFEMSDNDLEDLLNG